MNEKINTKEIPLLKNLFPKKYFFGEEEIRIIGFNDNSYFPGQFNMGTILVETNQLEYTLQEDGTFLHNHDGYCVFCEYEADPSYKSENAICYSGVEHFNQKRYTEIEKDIYEHWSKQLKKSSSFLNYVIEKVIVALDTYHLYIQFKYTGRLIEISYKVDEQYKVELNEVSANLPEILEEFVQNQLVVKLLNDFQENILKVCSPISYKLVKETLEKKLDNDKLGMVLHTVANEFKELSNEEFIKEILNLYTQPNQRKEVVDAIKYFMHY